MVYAYGRTRPRRRTVGGGDLLYAGDVHRRAFSVMSGAVPFRARNGRIGMAPSQDPTPSEAIETLALELLAILEEDNAEQN